MSKKKAKKRKAKKPELPVIMGADVKVQVHCRFDKLEDPNSLQIHPANPARHPKEQVELLAKIITSHGIRHPIIVSALSGKIVAGHCRRESAILLGLEKYPVVVQAFKDSAQELAVLVADNQIQELAEIDGQTMADVLVELDQVNYPLELTALTEVEIHDYVLGPTGPTPQDDVVPDPPKKPKTKTGDLYLLGEHRLLCGDATKAEDVERLMGGEKADMVFTDPPYALFGNSTGVAGVVDDRMVRPFFRDIFTQCRNNVKQYGHIYVCCDWHSSLSLFEMAKQEALTAKNLCIWDKGDGGMGAMYQNCFEMVWFFANSPIGKTTIGKKKIGHGERTINGKPNIWRHSRVSSEREHNAQKPTGMIVNAISASSDDGEICIDLFLGSGTTIIAAEKLGRKCYGLEIDAVYCDVIVKRWEDFTGKKAKRIRCKK